MDLLPQCLSIVDDLKVTAGGQSPPQWPGQQGEISVALQEVTKQHPQHIHKPTALIWCLWGFGYLRKELREVKLSRFIKIKCFESRWSPTVKASEVFRGTLLSDSSTFSSNAVLSRGFSCAGPEVLWKNKLLFGMGRNQGTMKAMPADVKVAMTRCSSWTFFSNRRSWPARDPAADPNRVMLRQ